MHTGTPNSVALCGDLATMEFPAIRVWDSSRNGMLLANPDARRGVSGDKQRYVDALIRRCLPASCILSTEPDKGRQQTWR